MIEEFSVVIRFGSKKNSYGFQRDFELVDECPAMIAITPKSIFFGAEAENLREEKIYIFNMDILLNISNLHGEGKALDLAENPFTWSDGEIAPDKNLKFVFADNEENCVRLIDIIEKQFFYLLRQIEVSSGKTAKAIYLVHPLNYSDELKRLIASAAKLCKVRVKEFISEPFASVFKLPRNTEYLYLKWGSGCLDTALIRKNENSELEVSSSIRDVDVKGDDLDKIICCYLEKSLEEKYEIDLKLLSRKRRRKLLEICENLKKALSKRPLVEFNIDFLANKEVNLTLSRSLFEELCKSTFNSFTDKALKFKEDFPNCKKIILCGGSINMPRINKFLVDCFSDYEIILFPEKHIIISSAIREVESRNMIKICCGFPLVVPFDLGVETMPRNLKAVIKAFTCYPCIKKEVFIADPSFAEQETGVATLRIFEGKESLPGISLFIGEINIEARANDHIDVTFDIDCNEHLTVKVANTALNKLGMVSFPHSALIREREKVHVLQNRIQLEEENSIKAETNSLETKDKGKNIESIPIFKR